MEDTAESNPAPESQKENEFTSEEAALLTDPKFLKLLPESQYLPFLKAAAEAIASTANQQQEEEFSNAEINIPSASYDPSPPAQRIEPQIDFGSFLAAQQLISSRLGYRHIIPALPGQIIPPVVKEEPVKKMYVLRACISCKAAHVACDTARPCQRCVRLNKGDTCKDGERKKRGRPTNTQRDPNSIKPPNPRPKISKNAFVKKKDVIPRPPILPNPNHRTLLPNMIPSRPLFPMSQVTAPPPTPIPIPQVPQIPQMPQIPAVPQEAPVESAQPPITDIYHRILATIMPETDLANLGTSSEEFLSAIQALSLLMPLNANGGNFNFILEPDLTFLQSLKLPAEGEEHQELHIQQLQEQHLLEQQAKMNAQNYEDQNNHE
ncbi:hypothetical protein HK103_004671 [Boothiomyces macroporosus]|uniref:Zn(2)-C6 fungal-type domain-containing protein n=1 Tax=Boothiomyces macroporosus TaxID=261099 RepID=A0AAD5Y8B1_9FUNG|nr:hypothetical protein HK103_004671 [Boothiomyces macroporosus]